MWIRDRLELTVNSTPEEIKEYFNKEYKELEDSLPNFENKKQQIDEEEMIKYVEEFSPYPFFLYAYVNWASDITFTAYPADSSEKEDHISDDKTRVSFKIDWYWFTVFEINRELHNQYINAIKNWALKWSWNTKTENQKISQDGKWILHIINKDKEIEKTIQLRLAFAPQHISDSKWTPLECCVIRLLDNKWNPDLEHAWFNKYDYAKLMRLPTLKKGLVVISWPTWSWKSSTLFWYIDKINDGTRNIFTLENPVEFDVPWVKQIEVSPIEDIPDDDEVTQNFTRTSSFLMRAAPDVILMWETRSYYTAKTSVEMANTWHITLTTLHTNSAISTLDRLFWFKSKQGDWIDRYALVDSLEYVSAQMLSPKLCKHCKIKVKDLRVKVKEMFSIIQKEYFQKALEKKRSDLEKRGQSEEKIQEALKKGVSKDDILYVFKEDTPDEYFVYTEWVKMLEDVDTQTPLVIRELSRPNIQKIFGPQHLTEELIKSYVENSYLPNLYWCEHCTLKQEGEKPKGSVWFKSRVMINETLSFDNYIRNCFTSNEMSNSDILRTLLEIRPKLPATSPDALVRPDQYFITLYQDALFKAVLPANLVQAIIPQYKETNESNTISILDAKKNWFKEI